MAEIHITQGTADMEAMEVGAVMVVGMGAAMAAVMVAAMGAAMEGDMEVVVMEDTEARRGETGTMVVVDMGVGTAADTEEGATGTEEDMVMGMEGGTTPMTKDRGLDR